MFRLCRMVYPFCRCSVDPFKGVLSDHIISILSRDPSYHQHCLEFMHQVNSQDHLFKVKCNLLFNIHSVNDSLLHLRPVLSQLVLQQQIQSKYELDQLLKWLTKQIKKDSSLGLPQITQQLQGKQKEQKQFQQELQQLQNTSNISDNQNGVCKWFRNKYMNIDSQLIYNCVSQLFKKKSTCIAPPKNVMLWDKLSQIKPRQLKIQCNSKEISQEHSRITQGKLRFRFPPEPNGYLHIGHLKSIRINFQAAKRHQGLCFLRFDDTNPQKQSHQFITQIQENIKWLNYTPNKISFASDYFEQMMYYANELVKKGHAYVCQSKKEDIQLERKEKRANPYRNRPVEESMKIFPHLKGNQTLRLKGVHDHPNPTLRDPIIYRIKQKPHPRTHLKYKIYPTYDFAHCLGDSLQHIDYSLCSLQFQIRRQLYYTFLDLLDLWKPFVWQYSRLNIEGNVLSKRKIKDLVDRNVVSGWNDPRLLTVRGLQARGYTPPMLFQFIDKISCSRSGNQNQIQHSLLQKQMKKSLTKTAVKSMAILSPFKIVITNFNNICSTEQRESQYYTLIQNQIFIEEQDAKQLELGSIVILKNIGAFQVQYKDEKIVKLKYSDKQIVGQLKKINKKLKIINWINTSQSTTFNIVMYNKLFKTPDELNPHSKLQHKNSLIPKHLLKNKPLYIKFQRIGFFKFTQDKNHLILCTSL